MVFGVRAKAITPHRQCVNCKLDLTVAGSVDGVDVLMRRFIQLLIDALQFEKRIQCVRHSVSTCMCYKNELVNCCQLWTTFEFFYSICFVMRAHATIHVVL